MSQSSQPMSAHTPTPWRASKCGFLMGSDGVGRYGPREVQVGKIGDFFDKELLPFNRDRWQADLELIVEAVNSHASLKARIEELEAALREMVYETTHLSALEDDGSHKCRISKGALGLARAALRSKGEA
jgi:hypothetical protein